MARRRLEELSLLNILFCLLVVLIHVLSHAVANLDKLSWQYAVVLVPQRLAFVSVYGFFFLSGLKLTLPRSRPQTLPAYYRARVKSLLIPYLLAAVIYYLFFVLIGWYSFSLTQLARETVTGTLSAPFYFLIALAQFILLSPLFRWLSRRYHPVFLLPLALGLTWLSSMHLNSILQLFNPNSAFPYADRIFTSYLVYYMAGCCAGTHYERFTDLLEENRSLLNASALFFGAADAILSILAYSGRRAVPYLEYIHTLYILSAVPALLGAARRHRDILQGTRGQVLGQVDRASFLIYLYHSLVITIFNILAPRIVGDRIAVQLVLRFLVVFPVSIIGGIIWQQLWASVKKCLK